MGIRYGVELCTPTVRHICRPVDITEGLSGPNEWLLPRFRCAGRASITSRTSTWRFRGKPDRGDRAERVGQVISGFRHDLRRGQRRYVETLSTYARQFLDQMERPDVDAIDGLSPSISIEQKTTSRSPRSTVGTITEIYDYLRLLFASIGVPHCPKCGRPSAASRPSRSCSG
jgi:hypothetical protein